jgi:hypothetical protein
VQTKMYEYLTNHHIETKPQNESKPEVKHVESKTPKQSTLFDQKHPGNIKKHPGNIKKHPGNIKKHPSNIKKQPSNNKSYAKEATTVNNTGIKRNRNGSG